MFVKSWWVNTHHAGVVAEVENWSLPFLPKNGLSRTQNNARNGWPVFVAWLLFT